MLRLHLRGRDDEGPEAGDRRGVRLDRAREALHDDDDGAVPGEALPPLEHPRSTPTRTACTRRRSGRRQRGRRGRRSSSGCSQAASSRRRGAARCTAGTRKRARRSSGPGRGSARTRTGRAGGRGARGARVARGHRRLHARQALRRGPGSGGVAGAAVPEPLRRPEAGPDPLRRAHLGRRAGSWTTAPSRGSPTTCSTSRRPRRAPTRCTAWFEWWNAVWGYEVEIVERHGRARRGQPRGAALAGGARAARRAPTCRPRSSGTSTRSEVEVAGVPTLALRIGFVGELGYELHFPSPAGEHLWDAWSRRGRAAVRPRAAARPAAREGARHRRAGHGLRVEPLSSGMSWLPKLDKDDFVGKFALEHFAEREEKERLVGFRMEDDVLPAEGAQVVIDGHPARARDERAAERGASAGHRARVGAGGAARSGDARRDPGRPRCGAARASRTARSSTPPGSGCARDPRRSSRRPAAPKGRSRRRCAARCSTRIREVVRDLSLGGVVEVARRRGLGRARRGRGARSALAAAGASSSRRRPAEAVERVRGAGALAYDATGALAGIAIASEQGCGG